MPFDVPRTLRASKLRVGSFRATGVPAILLGAAAVVVAAGLARSFSRPIFVDTLRETTNLVNALNGTRSLQA
jgi:hypothetical protein